MDTNGVIASEAMGDREASRAREERFNDFIVKL